jgi:ferric-dicitrate binding protein FerR (iron transport regulator)
MSDESPFDLALVDRYLAGECSQDEVALVRKYLDGIAPEWRGIATLEQALAHWKAQDGAVLRPDRGPSIRAQAETSAHSRVEPPTSRTLPFFTSTARAGQPPRTASTILSPRRLAASALAMILGVLGIWFVAKPAPHASSPSGIARVYRTANAQYATVTLPDGSHVRLGPATTLSVLEPFGRETRTVALAGAATFTVDPDPRVPFIVKAGSATVKVLGTTFLVRHYASDHAARVAVSQGRVLLRSASVVGGGASGETILPASALGIAADSGAIVVMPNGASAYAGWTDGTLQFQDTPLRDVLADIGRAYDVDITVSDSTLLAKRVTFAVPARQQSLSQALDDLAFLIGAHYTRSDRTITFTPGRVRGPRTFPTPHLTQDHVYGR